MKKTKRTTPFTHNEEDVRIAASYDPACQVCPHTATPNRYIGPCPGITNCKLFKYYIKRLTTESHEALLNPETSLSALLRREESLAKRIQKGVETLNHKRLDNRTRTYCTRILIRLQIQYYGNQAKIAHAIDCYKDVAKQGGKTK